MKRIHHLSGHAISGPGYPLCKLVQDGWEIAAQFARNALAAHAPSSYAKRVEGLVAALKHYCAPGTVGVAAQEAFGDMKDRLAEWERG